ncbi:MAG: hypothetical protein KGL39_44395 [Patescibacteria group bacterium]|nr:hypothetical protein [Patescibacteria group bacterium]
MPQPNQPAASPAQINRAQRNAVLQAAVPMRQQVATAAIAALSGATAQVNLIPRFVGLWKKFVIKITGTVNNTGATAIDLTDFGLANLLQSVQFLDLNGNQRVLTSGMHLALLASVKEQFPGVSSALLATALSQFGNFGDNFNVIVAPASIANGTSANFTMYFELPCAYSDEDLRGAIWGGVVNATANIQLNFNSNPIVAAGSDSTFAVYKGGAGNISGIAISLYQEYLDQVPRDPKTGSPILPIQDLATVYLLNNTQFTGIPANQDFPLPFANFRDFLSTFVLYNHDGSADAGRTGGTDISYLSLQSANTTNIDKVDPITHAYRTRKMLKSDLPPGTYYNSYRKKPISTIAYGNMQIILNASTATQATNYANVMWEQFALVNQLTQGGSLAG